MEIQSYLAQLHRAAEHYGVSLADAADAEGIDRSTVWRWDQRNAEPKYHTTLAVLRRLKKMSPKLREQAAGA